MKSEKRMINHRFLFFATIVLLNLLHPCFAQEPVLERPIVRLVYFLPNDRRPQPDIEAKMHALIKEAQQFYADQMRTQGFGTKTFIFETDRHGRAVVHRVRGKFNDAYYQNSTSKAWEEISERFDLFKGFYLTAIDISSELIDNEWCGRGGFRLSTVDDNLEGFGGLALIPRFRQLF